MTDCTGQNAVMPTCDSMLGAAILAYNALITGSQEQEVMIDSQKVRYTPANAESLKSHIRNLHAVCGNATSTAILGLNTTRRGALGTRFGNCAAWC